MSSQKLSCDILIIGAGAVGLAVASRLPKKFETILVERHPQFGSETSSRNSEVIHSGIYYPKDSLKTRWCIEGRESLYGFAEERKIPHRKTGKFVVATTEADEAYLEDLSAHCHSLGVPHRRVTGQEVGKAEPLASVRSALHFPESGIIDSHALMASCEREFQRNGGTIVYRHSVQAIRREGSRWEADLASSENIRVSARVVVNCAGLGAALLSNEALGARKYEHRFCRGRYFSLAPKYQGKFSHLIYPTPEKDGLGVHVTLDQAGFARLGPDVDWCESTPYSEVESLYRCDWDALAPRFLAAVKRYLPNVSPGDIAPAQIGVRPKLFIDGVACRDFLVENHSGFIHCLGIESPGLTASLRIADEVGRYVEEIA